MGDLSSHGIVDIFQSHGKVIPCPCSFFYASLWADICSLPPPVVIRKHC